MTFNLAYLSTNYKRYLQMSNYRPFSTRYPFTLTNYSLKMRSYYYLYYSNSFNLAIYYEFYTNFARLSFFELPRLLGKLSSSPSEPISLS